MVILLAIAVVPPFRLTILPLWRCRARWVRFTPSRIAVCCFLLPDGNRVRR
ncbi:hypothetical protein KCP70_16990 [Salmonella enterica subsp. enterica]|nr:hypothetical protein KCP70_16990 [Salmonella enterica subsp. enterica]